MRRPFKGRGKGRSLTRIRTALPLLLAAFAGLIGIGLAQADFPSDVRWDTPCLTHSGDADLDALIGPALSDWGQTSTVADCGRGNQITAKWTGPTFGIANATIHFSGSRISRCTILFDRPDFDADTEGRDLYGNIQLVMTHEVGHCLGLNHRTSESSIMYYKCCGGSMSPGDRELIARKYPPGVTTTPEPTFTQPPAATPTPGGTFTPAPSPTPTVGAPPTFAPVPTATPAPGTFGIIRRPTLIQWNYPDVGIAVAHASVRQHRAIYHWSGMEWERWTYQTPEYVRTLKTLKQGEWYWVVPLDSIFAESKPAAVHAQPAGGVTPIVFGGDQ